MKGKVKNYPTSASFFRFEDATSKDLRFLLLAINDVPLGIIDRLMQWVEGDPMYLMWKETITTYLPDDSKAREGWD
jgi:hypothetical protein